MSPLKLLTFLREMAPSLRRRKRRAASPAELTMTGFEPVIDLSGSPSWDDVDDIVEGFDGKLDSFMAFDDDFGAAERSWLLK